MTVVNLFPRTRRVQSPAVAPPPSAGQQVPAANTNGLAPTPLILNVRYASTPLPETVPFPDPLARLTTPALIVPAVELSSVPPGLSMKALLNIVPEPTL